MKCVELEVMADMTLLEAGGLSLVKGQTLVVDANMADRLYTQYSPALKKGAAIDRERLQGVWYEAKAMDKKAEPKVEVKDDPKKKEEPKSEDKKAMDKVAENKSMGSDKGKQKVHTG